MFNINLDLPGFANRQMFWYSQIINMDRVIRVVCAASSASIRASSASDLDEKIRMVFSTILPDPYFLQYIFKNLFDCDEETEYDKYEGNV